MSKPLAFGLNKKPGASKPAPRRKPMFGGEDSDSDANDEDNKSQAIGGDLDDDFGASRSQQDSGSRKPKSKPDLAIKGPPPKLNAKSQLNAMFGDLSSSLTSRKNAASAAEVDASVYEYDNVYESFKPQKQATKEDVEKKPKYMKNLIQAADVRKRDLLIAEEKKIAREREAEGDEFADKEKFVTAAYKKQQEKNRRIEEEEKKREEEEAKKGKAGGMSAFYRQLLDRDEQRHAESVKAAEEMTKNSSTKDGADEPDAKEEDDDDKVQAARARALNEKGASVDVNEDGQVVDKRQLLRGGLNLDLKKKTAAQQQAQRKPAEREPKDSHAPSQAGRRQAMRERQSRMMEEQLEQSMKRAYDDEETKKQELERASKSRKTEGEISSAKERYLARKRAADEAKKTGGAAPLG
ncbi:coiled-coil domain-containing protein 55 [Beauveria brongniartii RCEF 3172]|uniref:Coiled-coil domain-containing protein 55 n=1 Tax=Beauveria brongniartii RCEF 3172 TaxID=1081107 RepID=A0A167HTQ9_9HYPO|nr:coiled-coil domain-containing protein 55 [Beauveria brongniartii RCEF 3172]